MSTIESGPFKGLVRNGYGLISADPAWGFKTFNTTTAPHRTEEAPYAVMTHEELAALPVGDLAARDCVLAMWVIGSHLEQALTLGKRWGFTFKTDVLTWVKTGKNDPDVRPISMGFWSRKQTETMLLFTKGKPKRLDAGVRQLIETNDHLIYAPKREHSRKPDETHDRLQRLCAGPYIELFARKSRPGWTSWGNEATKFDDPLLGLFEDEVNNDEANNEYEDMF